MKKRGRPKSQNPLIFRTVGLTADQWAWLYLWHPGCSPTAQLKELFDRSYKFWPGGPSVFRTSRASAVDTIDSSGWLQCRIPTPPPSCGEGSPWEGNPHEGSRGGA